MSTIIQTISRPWSPPPVPDAIPHGDMPGDSIHIGETHQQKANVIFPELLKLLPAIFTLNPHQRAVIAVCGGSGVGKSETASLLSHYFRSLGIGSYTLSGDNYPHRIPKYNDAERLRIFRKGGLRGLLENGLYTQAIGEQARAFQREGLDGDTALEAQYPWMATYNRTGAAALQAYLGSPQEIDFKELNEIVSQFKNGADAIFLKRMGREETELWYERVDFSATPILIIEWTHANNGHLHGVDVPILLNSTPAETLAYRKTRHRDGGVDSPFTTMVLALEQKLLESQAYKAKIIVSKAGELLSYRAYRRLMAEE
ncbi:MAG TPA: adenylylsulfate kinase [Candidatus Limiplasma sp.]|nr:adenylylsulfate kinase [Candidatus Limiplasma sp.]HRX08590.1 adenylylsulfate kinase [Candidatus Limiplasma sp.]